MVKTTVHAGVCGFVTTIRADSPDAQNVEFKIESDCKTIQDLGGSLGVVDAYAEIGDGFSGKVHEAIRSHLKGCCSGCAVPVGIFKSMQVAACVALPANVSIEIEKE